MNLLADNSYKSLSDYLSKDNRIILPLGATEEHGPHLGLGTDSFEAEAIANAVGTATGVMIAPTLNYGMSQYMMDFPGTITLQPSTLTAVLADILNSLHHHGFRRVLIVNGHGGNSASINKVMEDVKDLSIKIFEWWKHPEVNQLVEAQYGKQLGSHASFAETSVMLAIQPQAVDMDYLTGSDALVNEDMKITVDNFKQHFPDGIMGRDPSGATAEAGKKIVKRSVEICCHELDTW